MRRWTISLGLLLLGCTPAWADILYVDPTKAPPKPAGAIGQVLKDPNTGKPIQIAIRGRIVGFAPPGTAPGSFYIDFEIAKKVGHAIVFHTPAVRIDWLNVKRIVHEVDHPIDLRLLLGNIDERLIQWKSLNQSKAGLGRPLSSIYVKHAMGLLTDAELTTQLQTLRRGPPAVSWIPTQKIPNDPSLPAPWQGWLVRLIQEGPVNDPVLRWQRIQKEQKDQGLIFPPLALEPMTAGDPNDPVGVDIRETVRSLLKAAARDAFYGNRRRLPRGGIGVFMGVASAGRTIVPKFGTLCLGVVRMLCGLTQYTGNTPQQKRAYAIGLQARQAVIQSLAAAAPGSLAGKADQAEIDRLIAEAPPAVRAAMLRRKQQLERFAQQRDQRQLNVDPNDPGYMPVDPSLVAMAGLKTIQGSVAWRVPVGEDDGSVEPEDPHDPPLKAEAGYLVRTLVRLAKRPKASDPRARDYGRQPVRRGGTVQVNRDLGVRTRLRDEIEETLCGAAGLLNPDPITRTDTGKGFRPFLTPLLGDLEDDVDANFLQYCLAQAGFGSAAQLKRVVERLFSIALANNDREQAPLPVDRLEARDRRGRAIGVLGRIASLGESQITTASGRPARAPTPAEKAAADMVKQRLTELLAARDAGRANRSSGRFFSTIKQMATAPAPQGLNPYDRAALQRRYAQEIVRVYGSWVDGDRNRRLRELEQQIQSSDEVLDADRRRHWEEERDRLQKAAREYRRRFGHNQQGSQH